MSREWAQKHVSAVAVGAPAVACRILSTLPTKKFDKVVDRMTGRGWRSLSLVIVGSYFSPHRTSSGPNGPHRTSTDPIITS